MGVFTVAALYLSQMGMTYAMVGHEDYARYCKMTPPTALGQVNNGRRLLLITGALPETVMMLGIFNPWTVRDTETFKRAITKTGQVAIMIRQVNLNEHWTLDIEKIAEQIREALTPLGYYEEKHYIIAEVPNIVMAYAGSRQGLQG